VDLRQNLQQLGWYANHYIEDTFALIFHLLEEANAYPSGEDFLLSSRYIGDVFRCNRMLHLMCVKEDAVS